jgi:hypothetical protein
VEKGAAGVREVTPGDERRGARACTTIPPGTSM